MSCEINIIAAMSENRVIGREGKLPWHISEDLKQFRRLTKGNTVIMGRKTLESLGRPLPHRTNIVLTSDQGFSTDGCVVAHSLDEAIMFAKNEGQGSIFIIGGGKVYLQALDIANRLFLTIIHREVEGDTFFPDYSSFNKVVSRESHKEGDYEFEFVVLEKNNNK